MFRRVSPDRHNLRRISKVLSSISCFFFNQFDFSFPPRARCRALAEEREEVEVGEGRNERETGEESPNVRRDKAGVTMDDDGDMDSQSELVGSLSCWMMKNLSQNATTPTKPSDKLSLSLPDTVLLQDGHLFHWLFSKSGTVVKVCVGRLQTYSLHRIASVC